MTRQTFEATYPKAPFAELIRLGVVFALWLARQRAKKSDTALPSRTALGY